jgi:hypothetical protein
MIRDQYYRNTVLNIQEQKDKRNILKVKEEIWRQDRKDRRAYLEFISSTNNEISNIHGILATRKNVGNIITGDRIGATLTKRIDNACSRINQFWDEVNTLNKKIDKAELELVNERTDERTNE